MFLWYFSLYFCGVLFGVFAVIQNVYSSVVEFLIFNCMADDNHKEILHKLGAEIVSPNRIPSIIDDGGMLPKLHGSITC